MDARPEWVRETKTPPHIAPDDHLAVAKAIRDLYRQGEHRWADGTLGKTAEGWAVWPTSASWNRATSFCLRGARFLFTEDYNLISSINERDFANFLGFSEISSMVRVNNCKGYKAVCDVLDAAIAKHEGGA